MLLERGNPVHLGEPQEIADRYLELNFGRDPDAIGAVGIARVGDGEARISEVWLESENGESLSAAAQHQRVTLNARVLFMVDVTDPSASVFVYPTICSLRSTSNGKDCRGSTTQRRGPAR